MGALIKAKFFLAVLIAALAFVGCSALETARDGVKDALGVRPK